MEQLDIQIKKKKMNLDFYLLLYTKINLEV